MGKAVQAILLGAVVFVAEGCGTVSDGILRDYREGLGAAVTKPTFPKSAARR